MKNQIAESLEKVFAPMDAEILINSQAWAKGRVEALNKFKASDERKAMKGNPFAIYERYYAISGGKTWYKMFDGRNASMIEEAVEKNCKATSEARNAGIAKKLQKVGINEVISESYTYSRDGFNGFFKVNTDAGEKVIRVETIYAGGYNIQCLHIRVLITVK